MLTGNVLRDRDGLISSPCIPIPDGGRWDILVSDAAPQYGKRYSMHIASYLSQRRVVLLFYSGVSYFYLRFRCDLSQVLSRQEWSPTWCDLMLSIP
jgi:hypothetical protein